MENKEMCQCGCGREVDHSLDGYYGVAEPSTLCQECYWCGETDYLLTEEVEW